LLTGKSFFSELRREAARAEAESMPFCVLMMDTDYFKEVNDTFAIWSAVKHWKQLAQSSNNPCAPATSVRGLAVKNSQLSCWMRTTRQGLVAAERVRSSIEKHEFPAVRRGVRKHRALITLRSV